MAGRPRKPTALKKAEGNRGKRPLPQHEPKAKRGIPTMPKHLNEVARKEWKSITKKLDEIGVLTTIDGTALAAYCDAYCDWVAARELLKDKSLIVKAAKSGYPIPHPALGIKNTALKIMHKFLIEFGMTPAARSKVELKPDKKASGVLSIVDFQGRNAKSTEQVDTK